MNNARNILQTLSGGFKYYVLGDQAVLEQRRSKTYKRKRRKNTRRITPFVIACGAVAALYFGYRLLLIAGPTGLVNVSLFQASADNTFAVCTEDDGSYTDSPTPILGTGYEQRIHNEPRLSQNLIANADLTNVDDNKVPIDFSVNIEGKNFKYQHLKDVRNDNKQFLRTVNLRDVQADNVAGGWIMKPINIKDGATYAYGFEYRSNVPVTVEVEYIKGERHKYELITELPPAKDWESFDAHMYNADDQADSFRFILTTHKAGQFDTRGYNMHQIADANLKNGVVSVTFDDGWQSVTDKAVRLLEQYDIRTTQYIISGAADNNESGYMNFGAVQNLKEAGHEIGSHTLAHCDQTMLADDNLQQNATRSKQLLEEHELGPVTSFAYPYGQYNDRTQQVMTREYDFIRTAHVGYNDRYFDHSNIRSTAVYSGTSDEEFRSWLDHAARNKLWLVIAYHRIDEGGEYSVSSGQLEKQLQMIRESGLAIQPLSEAAQSIAH